MLGASRCLLPDLRWPIFAPLGLLDLDYDNESVITLVFHYRENYATAIQKGCSFFIFLGGWA